MIKPRYLAGFTGHRKVENPDVIRQSLASEFARLKTTIETRGGVLELYTSAAYGADLIACEEAGKLGIPIHLVLPKPVVLMKGGSEVDKHAGFAADFWKDGTFLESEWDRAHRLIENAARGGQGGTLRLTPGTQTEPECYYDAGLHMLDPIDVLIAVWNEQPAEGLGGTEHMVSLARKRWLPLVIISAQDGKTKDEHLDRLADPDDLSRRIFDELESFSKDCAECRQGDEETARQFFKRLEVCSDRHSKHFRLSLVCTILWHGTATLVAAIAAVLPQTTIPWKIVLAVLAAIELSLVVRAYRRARRLHLDSTHERWMQSRFAAEIMRAMMHSAGLLDPLHPLIARHHPHWRRFAITAGLMIQRQSERHDWHTARAIYLDHRLRHPDPTIGQIAYFTKKQAEAEPRFKRTHWWGSKLGGAAILFVIGALVSKLYVITAKLLDKAGFFHLPYPVTVDEPDATSISWLFAFSFAFLPIALPLAAGIFISLRTALDSGRRTYRYQELSQRLTTAAHTLENLQTESAVRRTVAATEEVLLDELVEWHLAEQQNGAH